MHWQCHPDILYIRLLSFDELRFAMTACLPVVRPLMYYARWGFPHASEKNVVCVGGGGGAFATSSEVQNIALVRFGFGWLMTALRLLACMHMRRIRGLMSVFRSFEKTQWATRRTKWRTITLRHSSTVQFARGILQYTGTIRQTANAPTPQQIAGNSTRAHFPTGAF